MNFSLFKVWVKTIGPILMGMSKPVHVLQRGAEVQEIVNIAAIAVVDAQETEAQLGAELPRVKEELPAVQLEVAHR